jgi:hypothetical protein
VNSFQQLGWQPANSSSVMSRLHVQTLGIQDQEDASVPFLPKGHEARMHKLHEMIDGRRDFLLFG